MISAFFDDDMFFPQAKKYSTFEQFISKPSVIAIAVILFLGTSSFDVGHLSADCRDQVSNSPNDEFWIVF